MACNVLTMNNCGKLRKGYNEGLDWRFPQFQSIKETSVAFRINKIRQGCVGMVGRFKRSDALGTSIHCCYADDIVLNPTLDDLSTITCGGWNFQSENRILLYLNIFKHFLYAGRALHGARDVTAMIYLPKILAFVDETNRQIVTKFESVLFNTQVKSLKHDGNLSAFRNVMLDLLMQHNKYLRGLAVEVNIIPVALLQAADFLGISSDTLKAFVEKVKEQHKRMNKVSM